ncbi:MAG: hypothetical protein K0V04_15980 [Deltaproteobacteria bacterium]|nr:hypothetical protein [Deltaproteobacteria bacterium]
MPPLSPIAVEDPALRHLLEAYDIFEIDQFLDRVFPPQWAGIAARILETGATMSPTPCLWAPRWTPVPPTQRIGRCDDESRMRSIIFRVHDCLHQLWGLPHPGDLESADDFRYYKRAQMCGEIAVLTLCEFVYVDWLYQSFPELSAWIEGRCAVLMLRKALRGKSTTQVALRLDEFLHKNHVSRWVREDEHARAFAEYYTPMLQKDRDAIDQCWAAMKAEPGWVERALAAAPKARFADTLSGLELTCWMIADFEHLLSTTPEPDWALAHWNRERRATIELPRGWPGHEDS